MFNNEAKLSIETVPLLEKPIGLNLIVYADVRIKL